MPASTIIQNQTDLNRFCAHAATKPFVAMDTEFLREKTYWPKLCLIQMATDDDAAMIDPLTHTLDLTPLFSLLQNPSVTKVFHSARQDLEIFYAMTGAVPAPLFDTQIAAMVCGFGESIGYDRLVQAMIGKNVQKDSQFTDWSRRPLTGKQLDYALQDVLFLREIYPLLRDKMAAAGRLDWVADDMAILANPHTYLQDPQQAWQRVKIRNPSRKTLAVLQELAAWRELEARRLNIPRGHVLRDESLAEIAQHAPVTKEELGRVRGLNGGFANGQQGAALLRLIAETIARPKDSWPLPEKPPIRNSQNSAVVELLRVLLRLVSEQHGVAARLIATQDQLDQLAHDELPSDHALHHGWRYELFSKTAMAVKTGQLAFTLKDGEVVLISLA